MKSNISIVIPFYNASEIIDKCLESLENQTSKNFEVIFVNDCSKKEEFSRFEEKIKEYTFNYKIISNRKNSGPGITRNNGIKKCSSDYITFIDSDDFVELNFIEKSELIIKNNKPDIIYYDYYINKKICKPFHGEKEEYSNLEALALSNGMCWGKVYKKSIIEKYNIMFPNLIRSEDLAFIKVYLAKCKKIYYSKEPMYNYVMNKNSIMHTKKTIDINNNIEAFNYIKNNTLDGKEIEMIFIREYLYLIVQNMILTKRSTKDIKEFIDSSCKMYSNWYNNEYIKYQPKYLKILLFMIKNKLIFLLRIIFCFK